MSRQSLESHTDKADIEQWRRNRQRLARARWNPDWRWRRGHGIPEEGQEWSADDAFDVATSLITKDASR